jgi:hypothetical protein
MRQSTPLSARAGKAAPGPGGRQSGHDEQGAAEIDVPEGGATGPIAALGSESSGWSLYLHDSVPTYCYAFIGPEYTFLRAEKPLTTGRHIVRYEFEKTGSEPVGAGGNARLFVDGTLAAEGTIPHTCTVGYSMDETFDIGWDKGAPVTPDYEPITAFTGTIVKVDFDLKSDFHPDHHEHHHERRVAHALLRT